MSVTISGKVITPYNKTRYGSTSRIKYIVIHYVGALGGAEANARYYASCYVGASAHYFVGFDGEIWQGVADFDIAWHCGGGLQGEKVGEAAQYYKQCTNTNSIGIEMCVRKRNTKTMGATDSDWYFEDKTVLSCVELVKYLMAKYNVPASHVIRHYDVTAKYCPNPFIKNNGKYTWSDFKSMISGKTPTSSSGQQSTDSNKYYKIGLGWSNGSCQYQQGAYLSKDNAIAACKKAGSQYKVYDPSGKQVYPAVSQKETYRVGTEWSNGKCIGQKGAYSVESNAIKYCEMLGSKYKVYNSAGKQVYPVNVYIVEKGDTLSKIASSHNTTVDVLVKLNKLTNPSMIEIGDRIILP